MADINTNVLRFSCGGELLIDNDRVLNFMGGEVQITAGGRNKVLVSNNGLPERWLDGNANISSVACKFLLGYEGTALAATLHTRLQAAPAGTTGMARTFTVELRARQGWNQIKWSRWTSTTCVVKTGSLTISGKADSPAEISVTFDCLEDVVTFVDFTPGA